MTNNFSSSAQSHTWKEILSEGTVWQQVLEELSASTVIDSILAQGHKRREWIFVGCGTSYYLAESAAYEALWVVRPGEATRGPWCADLLLRSGAFALVVLDGAPVLPRTVAVRLTQLARESDAALLLLGEGTRASEVGGALRLRLEGKRSPGAAVPRVIATLEKGGPYQHVELEVGRGHGIARRLCTHPEIPDRRGVGGSRRALRGRRFAQPDYPAQRN